MHRVSISDVKTGAVLGASVFNERGRPFVRAGVSLTERSLQRVQERGYSRLVLITPGEDLTLEFVDPEIRAEVLSALLPAVDFLLDAWCNHTTPRPKDVRYLDRALRRAVANFVADARSESYLTLPGPTRCGPAQWLDDAVDAAAIAVFLGAHFDLDEPTLTRLAHGMLLRDVAMLALPPELREKPGRFTSDDRKRMKRHLLHAYDTFTQLEWMDELARLVILRHHERLDGSGYPYGLTGLNTVQRSRREQWDEDITLAVSDIAAAADVFNALTRDRPYRSSYPPEEIGQMLHTMMGVSLNQEVVTALLDRWHPPVESPLAQIA